MIAGCIVQGRIPADDDLVLAGLSAVGAPQYVDDAVARPPNRPGAKSSSSQGISESQADCLIAAEWKRLSSKPRQLSHRSSSPWFKKMVYVLKRSLASMLY